MSPLRSFGLSIVSLITLIVPAQVFAQDNATIAQELATELVTSVTKAMAMTVIGPLDDQRLALTDLGANKFQVTVAASTFLGQPLPEMVFIAQKAVGGLWVISQGRTKAPIKIKTGEDGLEIAVKELSWMGTWDSKNSEYIAISVSLTELEVTHPNLHLSVEYFKHTVGDRDKMTGEFLTGLYITDLAYQISLGAEAEEVMTSIGMPYQLEGKVGFFQNSTVLITNLDYRPFLWLSTLQDAVRDREAMINDRAIRVKHLKLLVNAAFQTLRNFGGHSIVENWVSKDIDDNGEMSSKDEHLSTQMTGWKDENGVFVVGMNLQNQGYDLTWPTGFFEEMNTFSFDESSSSLSMEGYNAGELEVQLLDLLDAYKEQKMQRLSFDRAVSLVRNLGGMKFEENVNSAKLSLNDDEQSYTADTLSVDLKFAALGEPEGRVGTGFSLAATNVTVSDNALSALQGLDLGAFLKPKTLRFAFGTAHQPLEAYDALSDDDATLAQGFAHLWKEVAPTVFGNFEWSNDDLIMSVRLKGDLEFEVEQDNAEAMDAHGNLEVIVIGLDALTEKLAGLSSENMTQESKELLFWLRAGLGVLSTYAKADENDSTLIDIRFGNKEDLNVNGHKLPFKTNEPFFN